MIVPILARVVFTAMERTELTVKPVASVNSVAYTAKTARRIVHRSQLDASDRFSYRVAT